MKKEEIRNESKLALWFKENFTIKAISINAIIAALYGTLTRLMAKVRIENCNTQLAAFILSAGMFM